jgi:hypothetical protein
MGFFDDYIVPMGPNEILGGGKGSKGKGIEYAQSPEQREIYKMLYPAIRALSGQTSGKPPAGAIEHEGNWYTKVDSGNFSGSNWKTMEQGLRNQAKHIPGAIVTRKGNETVLLKPVAPEEFSSTASAYDIPKQWNIPSPANMMPSQQNFEQFSPQVMNALWHPANQGLDLLFNRLGGMGQLGVPGAVSPAAGAASGRYMSEMAPQITQQAMQYIMPALQTNYQEQLGRNKTMWEAQATQAQMPFGILPGLLGGTYAQPVVHPQQANPMSGAIAGGMSGAMAGSQLYPGWGTLAGGALGAFGGYMGSR